MKALGALRVIAVLVLLSLAFGSYALSQRSNSHGPTSAISRELDGEIGRTNVKLLTEGVDIRGVKWRVFTYETPNQRQCLEISVPAVDATQRASFCDGSLFALGLSLFRWIRYGERETGLLYGVVAGEISQVRVLDRHGEHVGPPLVPVAVRAYGHDAGIVVLSEPPSELNVIELYGGATLVQRVRVAPPSAK